MDPNANLRERINIARTALERERLVFADGVHYDELAAAYDEWVAGGGFKGSHTLRETLIPLDREFRRAFEPFK